MQSNGLLLRNGDDVWKRIREGYQLTEVDSELVRRHERMYSAKPEYLKRTDPWSALSVSHHERGRAARHANRNRPVAAGESAFNPTAVSGARPPACGSSCPPPAATMASSKPSGTTAAAMCWAPPTPRWITWKTSTPCLATGIWRWRPANWGEGNVSRALERNRAKGLPETFEAIRMPNETRNYVPKLLAVRNILAEPERFGLKLDKFDNRPYFVAVSTGKHMDIDVAAKLAGMSLDELKPSTRRLTARSTPTSLAVSCWCRPARPSCSKNLAEYREPLLSWQVYTAQSGDNIDELAQRHGMSVERLRNVNGLASNSLAPASRCCWPR